MGEKSELHRDYILELENELHELEKREESATRRLQILVYPAMVAFIVLASYGFYLIQSLTTDVGTMAVSIVTISDSINHNMEVISTSTVKMSDSTRQMSDKMTNLVNSTEAMTGRVGEMTTDVGSMSNNIGVMRNATTDLATSTNNMQQDMWSLNQNISTPLSMFNKFIPWNNNTNGRFRGSNGPVPSAYYPSYSEQQYQPQQQPQQPQPQLQQAPVTANN